MNIKILCFLLLFPLFMNSQIKRNDAGVVYYQEIFEFEGKTHQAIKDLTFEWIAINFNDANHVIKMNTEDKIINKGNIKTSYNWDGIIVDLTNSFDMISEFKDNRLRLTLENITYKTANSGEIEINWDLEPISLDEFKVVMQNLINDMANSPNRKLMIKILNNPDKLEQHYANGIKARRLIYNSVVPAIEGIGKNLANYISNKSDKNSEW